MLLNFITVPTVLLTGLFFCGNNSLKARKNYIIIVSSVFLLLITLRSIWVGTLEVGADTPNYCREFFNVTELSWGYVLRGLLARYIYNTTELEFGYVVLQKFISVFTKDWSVFTFIINLSFFVPFGMFLFKNTKTSFQIAFAFVFFIIFSLNSLMCAGRQNYAVGLCFAAFLYIQQNKINKAVIMVLLAFLLHASAIVFLLVIFLQRLSVVQLKRIHKLTILSLPLVISIGSQIIFILGSIAGLDKYKSYADSGMSSKIFPFFIILVTILFYFLVSKDMLKKDIKFRQLYSIIPILTLLAPLSLASQTLVRLCEYFYLYLGCIIPLVIKKNMKDSTSTTIVQVFTFISMISVFYFMYGGGFDYNFFWQEQQLIDDSFYEMLIY